MAQASPEIFGKYQILAEIATGQVTTLHKASMAGISGFHRIIAIKRLLPQWSDDLEIVRYFAEKAKNAGKLTHANIVQILDLGQVDDVWFVAMEAVQGPDLGQILKRLNERGLCLPLPHALFIAIEILKALEYAHPVVTHHSIAPKYILISNQGEVKLTNFGTTISRLPTKNKSVSQLYSPQTEYSSPEQIKAHDSEDEQDLDTRTDLFSLGIVLHEMLTGQHPFSGHNVVDGLTRLCAGDATPLLVANPDLPSSLEPVVQRALAPELANRFQSATELRQSLARLFNDAQFLFNQSDLTTYITDLFPEYSDKPSDFAALVPDETTKIRKKQPTEAQTPTPLLEPTTAIRTNPFTFTQTQTTSFEMPTTWSTRLLISGVLLGFTAGMLAGGLVLFSLLFPHSPRFDEGTGTLILQPPKEARIEIAGQVVEHEVVLPAGIPHDIVINLPGHKPKHQQITLSAGEVHTLMITGTMLEADTQRP